ncbi:MAG TPA: hypothetical protein PLP34_09365 [Chitinophagaceae bacterium]|nr:hypothetical protein [Chitinophagaceae bacterium]
MLLALTGIKANVQAQTSICPTHVQNNSSSHITFNVQNTNGFPIVVTTVSAYIGSGSQAIQVLYNPTAINSSGATWTQGVVGAV